MSVIRSCAAVFGALCFGFTINVASATVVTSYADLGDGRSFFDIVHGGPFENVQIGGATLTATSIANNGAGPAETPSSLGGFIYSQYDSFWNAPFDPAVTPGNREGKWQHNKDVILNFDVALFAAGVTLFSPGMHGTQPDGVIVTAYSGPDATGTMLGTGTSPTNPISPPLTAAKSPFNFLYFVGVVGDGTPIRSLKLQPVDYTDGFYLDSIAVVVPEPGAGVALLGGAACVLRRRRSSRC